MHAPSFLEGDMHMPFAADTALELEVHLHYQVPQSETPEDLQLYFNNTRATHRAKKKASTKEDMKNVLKDLWGLAPEETPCKLFTRED